ncbi:MAG: glutathione S-transferase, partial [Sphingomonadales bacterium]|nr:glutathione S-transferase [Sphingomonadales bacterium]
MTAITVHGIPGSPFLRSVEIALREKGADYHLQVMAPGEQKGLEHLQRHPFGRVPAIEFDGFALYETQAILRYIDEGFPVSPLQPTDLHQFARMNQIMGIVDAYAWPAIAGGILVNRLLNPRLGLPVDEAAIAAAVPQARRCLSEIARLMG